MLTTTQGAVKRAGGKAEKPTINKIETETLIFALLNCADSAIGGGNLRQSLENYLLGGAALMMFDMGFAEATPYLTKM